MAPSVRDLRVSRPAGPASMVESRSHCRPPKKSMVLSPWQGCPGLRASFARAIVAGESPFLCGSATLLAAGATVGADGNECVKLCCLLHCDGLLSPEPDDVGTEETLESIVDDELVFFIMLAVYSFEHSAGRVKIVDGVERGWERVLSGRGEQSRAEQRWAWG